MIPADNALSRARRQAHENFRAQAMERARASLGVRTPRPEDRPGNLLQNALRPGNTLPRGVQGALSGGGHPESASSLAAHQATNAMGAQLAGANLGGALNGGGSASAPIPSWVLTQMSNEMQGDAGRKPNPFFQHNGGEPAGFAQILSGHGPIHPFGIAMPMPGVPRLPEHPLGSGSGLMPRFIHLGGGLFLHPETGEIHGMGMPVSSTPSALPAAVHPGMVAA